MMHSSLILPITQGILALLFLDPLMVIMPENSMYITLGLLTLITAIYTVIIAKEQSTDEREEIIRGRVDRYMYLASMIGLVSITGYYLITKGMVYPEIIILLVLLTIIKIGLHMYGERNW